MQHCLWDVNALMFASVFVLSVFSAVGIDELKNRDIIDGLDKRSEYKGMVGLQCKRTVSPLNVSAADTQINHCD